MSSGTPLPKQLNSDAMLCPWMDLLFGTYRCPAHEPEELGVEGDFPQDYLGQLAYPFLKEPGQ